MNSFLQYISQWFYPKKWTSLLLFTLCMALIIQLAWVNDDAYITFRSVENFLAGYGPVHNVGFRVQVFTHPLWFLLMSTGYFITLKIFAWGYYSQQYFIVLSLSFVFSFLTLLLVIRISRSNKGAVLGLLILSLSKAFVEYSTSGLENPLTHFLLATFIYVYFKQETGDGKKFMLLLFLASLSAVNRLDTILFYIPCLVYVSFEYKKDIKKLLKVGVLGSLPLILWEIFSLIYYGTFFPNTAFAKLSTGIPKSALLAQGFQYYQNSLLLDPITLVSISAVLVIILSKRNKKEIFLLLGLIMYLAYIVNIGGDFMSGRYFSTPLLFGVLLLVTTIEVQPKQIFPALTLILLLGLVKPTSPWRSTVDYGKGIPWREFIQENGIADERGVYFKATGLFRTNRSNGYIGSRKFGENWVFDPKERTVEQVLTLGFPGFKAGPNVHVVDKNVLSDPLMARLPIIDPVHWRIGHFERTVPQGYLETLEFGNNVIENEDLALYYEKLELILSGDLFSKERLIEIWNMNIGMYDQLIENYIHANK